MRLLWLALAALLATSISGCLSDGDDGSGSADGPAASGVTLYRDGAVVDPADLPADLSPLLDLESTWLSVDGRDGREPTVGVDSSGAIYYAARDYSGGQTPPVSATQTPVMKSTDGGLTWEDVSPLLPTGDREPPRSGDPMVWVDPWTDRIFQIELYDLVCNWLVYSDDAGATWTGNAKACASLVVDHQTIGAGPSALGVPMPLYENIVYVCVNQIADSHCARSLTGGLTFETFTPVFLGVDPTACGVPGGIHGHVLVDPTGTVYLPRQYCGEPFVGISRDDGLTWERIQVADGIGASEQDPNMAFDGAGNVYYFWIGADQQAYLVWSDDHGATWSEPVRVTPDEVVGANHPSVTAGSDGRVGLVYLATHDDYEVETWDNVTWDGYVAVSLDATSDTPTFATRQVNPDGDFLYRGDCTGQRCGFIREFLDASVAPDGSYYGAFIDACLRPDEPRATSEDDCNMVPGDYGEGNGHLAYVVQVTGPSLYTGERELSGGS